MKLSKTPLGFKAHMIKELVYNHQEWILRSINKVPSKNQFDFITGGMIPYLGNKYKMVLIEDKSIKFVKFEFYNDHFTVKCKSSDQPYEEFIEGLMQFYKFQAKKVIDPLFEKYALLTGLVPDKITYRSAKTRWGSCSYNNRISINYKLLQFDLRTVEYVVLHELCHIVHKNHSKKFWDMVLSYMSDYKDQEKLLRGKLF
jgi:hypothetical protein